MKSRKFNRNILPYPVLNADNDDVLPSLRDITSREVHPQKLGDSFIFSIKLLQLNQTIKKLIEEGKAEYMAVLTCPVTFLQKTVLSKDPEFTIEIPKTSVNGHLDVDCYVVLKEDITYTNIGFADIYEGISFDLEAGNILVAFPHWEQNMDLTNEKMFASKAFVEFIKSEKETVDIDLEQDLIYVALPVKMYERYMEIQQNSLYSDLVISSIVHEAIMMAIIGYDGDTHSNLRWADGLNILINRTSNKRFTLKKMSKEERVKNVWEMANLVLRNPHERLFESLIDIEKKLNSDNE